MAAQGYTGKTVIVVDADSPFGSATVDLVMSKGANVVANSPRDRTYQEPEPTHKGRLLRTQVQAASAATIAQRALSHFGHIDVVINNVEVGHSGSFRDGAEPDWRENVLEALKRAFKVTQAVFPHFKQQAAGKIINVCTAHGQPGFHFEALKFGLLGLTKTTALEGKKYNVGSFLVAPSTPNLISPDETGESDIAMPDTDALVSTVGALALADHSDDTGTLFEVSGRRVVKLRWQRSMGAALQTGNTFTPAALLDRFEDIIDMSKPEHPSGPVDTAKALSRRLLKLGRTTDDGRIGFKDQVVVVTGAGGGLGRAHALLFARLGASVVVNDLKNSEAVAEEIRKASGKAVAQPGSATDGAAIVDKAIQTYGRVDVVVNNAGFLRDRTLIKMEDSSWDAVLDVHLNGMYQVTKAAWPHFLRQGRGRVINTTSTSGIYGFFGQANYSAAKLGMLGLADALAREGAKSNIIVNCIAPIAATAGLAAGLGDNKSSEEAEALRPELISPWVALLASEQAVNLANGGLFELAGGWHSRTVLQRSSGQLFSESFPPTLDNVSASWSGLTSLDTPRSSSPETNLRAVIDQLKGREIERNAYRFDDRDVILYNLSVGANRGDMSLVYENSPNFMPLPTFGVIPAVEPWLVYHNAKLVRDFSDKRVLHGEHYLEVLQWPIPTTGSLKTYATVLDVVDKGTSAVTITGLRTKNTATGQDVFYQEASFFLRGSGGFGGDRVRQSPHRGPALSKPPNRPADIVKNHKTSEEQAALYRLTGDRMAMHIDPEFSSKAGYPQPILHGLGFMGIAGYHLFKAYGSYKSLRVRFSGVVIPGQTLRVEMWRDQGSDHVAFRVTVLETGKSCIEGGVAMLVGESTPRL